MLTTNVERTTADQLRARAAELIEQAEALEARHIEIIVYPIDDPEQGIAAGSEFYVPVDPADETNCEGCQ